MCCGNGCFKKPRVSLKNWSDFDIGYLAGIIDGEGCLNLYNSRGYTHCRLTINTTDKLLASWLKEKLGTGGVNKEKRRKPKPHHKQVYIFLMAAQADMFELLKWITPHLSEQEFEVLISLMDLRILSGVSKQAISKICKNGLINKIGKVPVAVTW